MLGIVIFTCIFAGGLGLFFSIYYACLGGFFLGMLTVFFQTLELEVPRLMGTDSCMRNIPGICQLLKCSTDFSPHKHWLELMPRNLIVCLCLYINTERLNNYDRIQKWDDILVTADIQKVSLDNFMGILCSQTWITLFTVA